MGGGGLVCLRLVMCVLWFTGRAIDAVYSHTHQVIINGPEPVKLECLLIPVGNGHHLVVRLITNHMIDEVQPYYRAICTCVCEYVCMCVHVCVCMCMCIVYVCACVCVCIGCSCQYTCKARPVLYYKHTSYISPFITESIG